RRRPGGDPGQQLQRRGHLVPAGEVVLDEEGGPKAERLGLHAELDEVVKAVARGGAGPLAVRLRAAEHREAHRRAPRPSTPPHFPARLQTMRTPPSPPLTSFGRSPPAPCDRQNVRVSPSIL